MNNVSVNNKFSLFTFKITGIINVYFWEDQFYVSVYYILFRARYYFIIILHNHQMWLLFSLANILYLNL